MKILIIPSSRADYLQDAVYLGLKELFGSDVECIHDCFYLYKNTSIDRYRLYGYGFSYTNILEPELFNICRNPLEKLKNNYYDLIVYSCISNNNTLLDDIMQITDGKNVFLINGVDEPWRMESYNNKCIYFKRSLESQPESNTFPIYYAIHHSKIIDYIPIKSQELSKSIPSLNYLTNISSSKILFDNEKDYYYDYQISKYGLTKKKGGWDCMRHYEILANRCIPLFQDIKDCPELCLTNLPKKILSEIIDKYPNIDDTEYSEYQQILFEYTQTNLTTKKLAQYLMSFYA